MSTLTYISQSKLASNCFGESSFEKLGSIDCDTSIFLIQAVPARLSLVILLTKSVHAKLTLLKLQE